MKKLLPYSLVCVEEIENWLNEMALNGYHLIKLNSIFATFEEGEPKDVKYSLVFHPTEGNKHIICTYEPELDIYHEYGWKLIQKEVRDKRELKRRMKPGYFSIYKSIVDNPTKNIQKDILSLEYLAKPTSEQMSVLSNLAVILFTVTVTAYQIMTEVWADYFIDIDKFYLGLIWAIPLFLFSLFLFRLPIKLSLLKRYYRGKRSKPKKGVKPRSLLTFFLAALCLVIVIIANPVRLSNEKEKIYLGNIDNLVNLRVMEGEQSTNLPDHVLDDNYHGYKSIAPFMPLHYSLEEGAFVGENINSHIYINVIYTKAYITFPFDKVPRLALGYMSGIFGVPDNKDKIYYTSTPHFYEIMYFEKEYRSKDEDALPEYFMVFRSKYEMLVIEYIGNRTPEEIIANVEALFAEE